MKKSTVFILVLIGFMACTENQYIEYKPHYVNAKNDEKYYGDAELESTEFQNTIQVLEFYGHDYKTKNGNTILIKEELHNNWDLLWNYTTKANDKDWLKSHKPG